MRAIPVTATVMFVLLGLSACTSMLVGASGTSAGRPIGQDNRGAAVVAADDRISAIIRERLAADADFRRASLTVETREGVVTLKGTLTDFDDRDRAVRLSQDVPGVVRVQNQISVRTR